MRYLGCLWLCLISLISYADESKVSGSMACEVKSSSIIQIENGIAKTFSGFDDRFEVGDTLSFDYKLIKTSGRLSADLIDKKRSHTEMPFTTNLRDMVSFREDLSLAIFKRSDGDGSITFGANYLRFLWYSNELVLNRYYKNDWNGIATVGFGGDKVHVFTLDCKHNQENVDVIVELMKQSYFTTISG